MRLPSTFQAWAKRLKEQTLTVYYIAQNPQTPSYVKVLALIVAAYALSPIDLIPDFIPVLGLVDDILLVPLGVALVVRLTPAQVIVAAQEQAREDIRKPPNYLAAVFIVVIWLALLYVVLRNLFLD